MYNLKFDSAHRTFEQYEREHPADPLGPVSDAAAYLYSEFDRLRILQSELFTNDNRFLTFSRPRADPDVVRRFEGALDSSKQKANQILASSPQDADALFATTLRLGLHADYLALIEHRNLASLSEIKEGRAVAEKLLAMHPEYYDAHIAVGVENYLLSLKSAPLRWLLRASGAQTDKQTGIEQLRLTAEKGRYLLPYARLLLAVVALRDRDIEQAKKTLSWLAGQFPGNRLYREELAKLH